MEIYIRENSIMIKLLVKEKRLTTIVSMKDNLLKVKEKDMVK